MSHVAALYSASDTPSALTRPLLDRDLHLHELLIQHPASTFYVRLAGDSLQGAGLYDGDIFIVDRSLEAKHTDIMTAVLNGELTVKRLFRRGDLGQLRPANHRDPIITVTPDQALLIWGVVTGSIRQFHPQVAPSERFHHERGQRHKMLADWAPQKGLVVRCWVPDRSLVIIADNNCAVIPRLRRLQ